MNKRFVVPLLGIGLVLLGAAWMILRDTLEARLADATRRGLNTIVELVVADVKRASLRAPLLRGQPLLDLLADTNRELATTLQRAGDEYFRRVYFFNMYGQVYQIDAPPAGGRSASAPLAGIVRQALDASRGTTNATQGALFEPYPDVNGEPAIGVWRWLPELGLGVIAERPYGRFASPLGWLDGLFAALYALLIPAWLIYARRSGASIDRLPPRTGQTTCGPYEILRVIGEGSMSTLYLARHRQLKRIVALKRLKPHAQSDELSARFEREMRLASQLVHPNLITILDHGRATGGGFYYTMEYIHGLTLSQWIEGHGPVAPHRALRLLRQICAGVAVMHERKLLHRDIKPDNVMAYAAHDDYDLIKLLDFGLIKDLDLTASRDLTRDVRVLGTPAFMAPERLLDPRLVDPRTDLYGIGCIAFYLLTGRKPFEARLDSDLAQQVLHVEAPLVSTESDFPIPEALDRLVADALAKDMTQRPASARAMIEILDGIAGQMPWRREEAKLWWQQALPDAGEEALDEARPSP